MSLELDVYQIIKRPIITEKTTKLKEENKYVFEVHPKANKQMIKNAVEKLFNVKVLDVKTMNMKGKLRRLGRFEGYKPNWKKAIVKLAKGQTIKLLEELRT